MSEHTPGPWHVHQIGRGWCVEIGTVYIGWAQKLSDADAHLIAAAPDLIDACGQMLYGLRAKDDNELKNGMESARLAIAKAEGREPNG